MKTILSKEEFMNKMTKLRPDNFTSRGLSAIYEYLTQYEQHENEEIELDVVAICCDFCEYGTLGEFRLDYSSEDYETIEQIEEKTLVLKTDDEGFVVAVF